VRSPDGSAQLLDPDQVTRGIAEGALPNPVRLLGRLLDDLASPACSRSNVPSRSVVAGVSADLEAEGVAVEGQGRVRVLGGRKLA
jgi:hypothetical protein